MRPQASGVAPLAVPPGREADAGADADHPVVVSRHATGISGVMNVAAQNLNGWCRIHGDPFVGDIVLVPNEPDHDAVQVTYGPFAIPSQIDALTFLCVSHAEPRNRNMLRLDAAVADDGGLELARAGAAIPCSRERAVTIRFPGGREAIRLTLSASFDDLVVPNMHERVVVRYALGYRSTELAELLNQTGSDKGTAVWVGEHVGEGVPHCYALEYERLFGESRHEAFTMLEIGIDSARPPSDAPSLRAWRAYFPAAVIHGYDIEDFGFVHERDVFIHQGNQASRTDLNRLIEESGRSLFRIVLDDGSHASSHQQISLATLFPQVEPGGLYVIEDLGWQPFRESPTTLHVLREFSESRRFESPFVTEQEAHYLESMIDTVEILRPNDSEIGVLRKRAHQ